MTTHLSTVLDFYDNGMIKLISETILRILATTTTQNLLKCGGLRKREPQYIIISKPPKSIYCLGGFYVVVELSALILVLSGDTFAYACALGADGISVGKGSIRPFRVRRGGFIHRFGFRRRISSDVHFRGDNTGCRRVSSSFFRRGKSIVAQRKAKDG